jgi:hypothetical protein
MLNGNVFNCNFLALATAHETAAERDCAARKRPLTRAMPGSNILDLANVVLDDDTRPVSKWMHSSAFAPIGC